MAWGRRKFLPLSNQALLPSLSTPLLAFDVQKERPAGGGWGILSKRWMWSHGTSARLSDGGLRGRGGCIKRRRQCNERLCYNHPGQKRWHNNQMARWKAVARQWRRQRGSGSLAAVTLRRRQWRWRQRRWPPPPPPSCHFPLPRWLVATKTPAAWWRGHRQQSTIN